MAESIVKLRVDATGATSALKGVQNQTNKLQQSFGGLQTIQQLSKTSPKMMKFDANRPEQ